MPWPGWPGAPGCAPHPAHCSALHRASDRRKGLGGIPRHVGHLLGHGEFLGLRGLGLHLGALLLDRLDLVEVLGLERVGLQRVSDGGVDVDVVDDIRFELGDFTERRKTALDVARLDLAIGDLKRTIELEVEVGEFARPFVAKLRRNGGRGENGP